MSVRRTTDTMRIAELRAPQEFVVVEVPTPVPGPGEVLVEVAGCGLCHSDLTMVAIPGEFGEALGWQVPFTLGHVLAESTDVEVAR